MSVLDAGSCTSVIAPLHFVNEGGGLHYGLEHASSTVKYLPRDVKVTNARPIISQLALEKNGFILTHHVTKVTDFLNETQITEIYLPEVERLICDVTGGYRAKVFQHASRKEGGEKEGGRQPGRHAHCDYMEKTYRSWAEKLFGEAEAKRLLSGRWMIVNAWRGIGRVESCPLAVCDAASVNDNDMTQVTIYARPGDKNPPLYGHPIQYNDHQDWYYFPLMEPEEVLVFKQFDTKADGVKWGAHCAFDDPLTAADAKPRASFEVRAFVFFED